MITYVIAFSMSITLAFLAVHGRCSLAEKKNLQIKKAIYAIATVPLIVVAGLRYGIGPDYFSYVRIYNEIQAGRYSGRVEYGFYWIVKLVQALSPNSMWLFMVIAAITICVYFSAFYTLSDNIALSVALLGFTGVYFDSLNGIRQYIVVALFMLSIRYIIEKNKVKYVAIILIAMLFHYSAILLLPMYWVARLSFSTKKTLTIIVGAIVGGKLLLAIITLVLEKTPYAWYINTAAFQPAPNVSQMLFTAMIWCVYTICGAGKHNDMKLKVLYNLQSVALIIAWASFSIPLAYRVLMYFMSLPILSIPAIQQRTTRKSQSRFLATAMVLVYIGIQIYGIYALNWYRAIPYQSVLMQ